MREQRGSLLILDDDEAIRESLVCYFEDRGWEVIAAETAEEALDILLGQSPRAAIVDIRLPGMNGNAFLVKLSVFRPDIACLICTGSPEYAQPEAVAALPQVSSKVFTKPVADLKALEEELLVQIARCKRQGGGA